jgi:F-type H+-transporting ATPase subunit delta
MRVDGVARRYAQAVFELARESGNFDQWTRDLDAIAAIMSDAAVAPVLESERVRDADKVALIEQLLAGVSPLGLNLARLLVSNGRVDHAESIRDEFKSLLDTQRGIVHAHVTTAVPIGDEERALLVSRLSQMTGGQVTLQSEVNPEILGGLVVRIGDRLIDGSVRAKLKTLRRQLEGVAS